MACVQRAVLSSRNPRLRTTGGSDPAAWRSVMEQATTSQSHQLQPASPSKGILIPAPALVRSFCRGDADR